MCATDFRSAIPEFIQQNALPPDKYGHQPRLYALTRSIGAGLSYDDDVVFVAAWLHDLGVFIGHRPEDPTALAHWDHVAYTCSRVPEILHGTSFPQAKIPAVLEVVRTHQPADDPQTMEATIVRDADILEQLGAVGILRAVSKVGRDTRYPRFTDAITFLRRNLQTLPPLLRLDTTRRLAEPRIHALQDFLAATNAEAGANLF